MFGKWALADMTVSQMVLFRFLFASAGLSIAYWRAHAGERVQIDRRDWGILLAAAVIGVPLQYILQFAGLARTTVSHASLMVGVMPVLLAVAAVFYAKEKLALPGWLGLVASTIGAGLVAIGGTQSESSAATVAGDLLVVVSLLGGVVWVLLSQRLMRRYSPTATTDIRFGRYHSL